MLTRDQLIRETRARSGTLPALLFLYSLLLGGMVASAYAII